MYLRYIVLSVFLTYCALTIACKPKGGGWNAEPEKNITNKTDKFFDRKVESAWGGFAVPDHVKAQWKSWLDEYRLNRKLEANQSGDDFEHERGPGSGWPDNWRGLGGGYKGSPPEEPPPWAYKPYNIGLPALCYDAPDAGPCNKTVTRWAFNPYTEVCQEFQYGGCEGNLNNFKDEAKCTEKCMKTPGSGCNEDADIPVEPFVIKELEDDFRRRLNATRKCGYSYEKINQY